MIVIVMGVSGSGKTTIGKMLAELLHWEFYDADSFHSQANIEKMSRGIPLNDKDRLPWLQTIQKAMQKWLEQNKNVVLACSALKDSYRQALCLDKKQVQIVYLKGSIELIAQRLAQRQNHFMKAELLQSQFLSLEEPKEVIIIDIAQPPQAIIQEIKSHLKL